MNEDEDVKEVREILTILSEKIPALLNNLTDVLFGESAADKFAQAVAGFYKKLRESGMEEKQAFELTKTYMSNLDIAGMVSKFLSKPPWEMGAEGEETEDLEESEGKEKPEEEEKE
jgi:hypothetical protein